jgi:IS5 family transposase
MSLDVNGFDELVTGGMVTITISNDHRLVKLAQKLPWDEMLHLVLPDLQRTEKKRWWMGRPLRIRIHLGVYVLQQMFDLTDRFAEQKVRDNAAFRLFCGYSLLKKWHAPDHTKIEAFRSRLTAETQRRLANLITQQAVKLNYANPTELDVDSTFQEANIAYPAIANLLVKVALLASKVGKGLNQLCYGGVKQYHVGLSNLKQIALYYFNLKRKDVGEGILSVVLQRLWRETYVDVLPILNDLYLFGNKLASGKYWALRRAVETLSWRGVMLSTISVDNIVYRVMNCLINQPILKLINNSPK